MVEFTEAIEHVDMLVGANRTELVAGTTEQRVVHHSITQ